MPPRTRTAAKAARRQALIDESAKLFAAVSYAGASLEDIGRAVGVSGPAIYRHFSGKQDLLSAVLLEASEELSEGAAEIIAEAQAVVAAAVGQNNSAGRQTMQKLVEFHVDYALRNPEVIIVQGRELSNLTKQDRDKVRALQRAYVEVWIETLSTIFKAPREDLRLRVQATFGLLNSTPHATTPSQRVSNKTASTLKNMALASLTARL